MLTVAPLHLVPCIPPRICDTRNECGPYCSASENVGVLACSCRGTETFEAKLYDVNREEGRQKLDKRMEEMQTILDTDQVFWYLWRTFVYKKIKFKQIYKDMQGDAKGDATLGGIRAYLRPVSTENSLNYFIEKLGFGADADDSQNIAFDKWYKACEKGKPPPIKVK
jgi:hypothetical protein|eukprot:3899292-Prymnesium_polylepis.1